MTTMMCADIKMEIEKGIAAYNEALGKGDFRAMTAVENSTKEHEAEYAKQAMLELCSAHKDDEHPVYEVLKAGFVTVYRHKAIREDGVLMGWGMVEAERQVDLKVVMSYFKVTSKVWLYAAERLTEVLCEWASEEVKGTAAGVRDSFKMSKESKKIDAGPKPTSNTSMLKLLQHVIDEIICIPGTEGKNTIVANNRDLKFIQHCYDKEGRGKLSLATLKPAGLVKVVLKVIYRIANGLVYDVEYKKLVEKNPVLDAQRAANAANKAETQKTEMPKAEEPVEETVVIKKDAA